MTSKLSSDEIVRLSVIAAKPFVQNQPIQDSEEFAEATMALASDPGSHDPQRGSTRAGHYVRIARRAIIKFRRPRVRCPEDSLTRGQLFDRGELCRLQELVDVHDTVEHVISRTQLTDRQREVVQRRCSGESLRAITDDLRIDYSTTCRDWDHAVSSLRQTVLSQEVACG